MHEKMAVASYGTPVEFSRVEDDDSISHRRRELYWLVGVVCLGGCQFGYSTCVVNPVKIMLKDDFPLLTDGLWSIIVAACLGGCIVGALLAGTVSNKHGRRMATGLASALNGLGLLVMGSAPGTSHLALGLGRFISGVGIGILSATGSVYISECVPMRMRGAGTIANTVCLTGAIVIVSAIGVLFVHVPHGWRYIVLLGVIPAVLQLIGCTRVPESPQWLLNRGDEPGAKSALMRLRGFGEEGQRAWEDLKEEVAAAEGAASEGHGAGVFQDPGLYRALVLSCMLQLFQQLSGANMTLYFSATLIAKVAEASPALTAGISTLIASCNFLFTIAAIFLVERLGRKPLWILSHAGVTATLVMTAASFYYGLNVVAIGGLALLTAFYAMGLGCLPWTVAAEVFPVHARGTGNAIATAVNWSSNLLCSVTFLPMIHALSPPGTTNPWPTFALYAVANGIGLVCIYIIMPETKGFTSEEITQKYRSGWSQRKPRDGYAPIS